MGHNIHALIGKVPIKKSKIIEFGLAMVEESGFAIVILNDDSIDYWSRKLGISANSKTEYLNYDCDLIHFFSKQLEMIHYAIVQTDYFGGKGEQYAGYFVSGDKITESNSINVVLKLIGVKNNTNQDAFDTINLCEYRHSEDYYWESNPDEISKRINLIPGRIFRQ